MCRDPVDIEARTLSGMSPDEAGENIYRSAGVVGTGCTGSVIPLQERSESTGGSNASPGVSETTWTWASSAGTATRPKGNVAITAPFCAESKQHRLSSASLQVQTRFLHLTVVAPCRLLDRLVQQ